MEGYERQVRCIAPLLLQTVYISDLICNIPRNSDCTAQCMHSMDSSIRSNFPNTLNKHVT